MVVVVMTEDNGVDIGRRDTSVLPEDVSKLSLNVILHSHFLHHLDPFGRVGGFPINANPQVEEKPSIGWFVVKEENIHRPN